MNDQPTLDDTLSLLREFHGENDTIGAARAWLLVQEVDRLRAAIDHCEGQCKRLATTSARNTDGK